MKMNRKEMYNLAKAFGLKTIETTSERTGYPMNEMLAIVGFDTIEQAEEIAQKYHLRIISLYKRAGWHCWYRDGWIVGDYDIGEIYCGLYGYDIIQKMDRSTYYENCVKSMLSAFDTEEETRAFLEREEEIMNALDRLGEDEAILTYEGRFDEIIKLHAMRFSHDSQYYEIGLISI